MKTDKNIIEIFAKVIKTEDMKEAEKKLSEFFELLKIELIKFNEVSIGKFGRIKITEKQTRVPFLKDKPVAPRKQVYFTKDFEI